MKKLLAVLVLVLAGCCSDPTKDEVTQERALTNVVKPRFLEYSKNDPTLSPAKKQDDIDFWDAWESRLADREKRAGK